MAFARGDSFPSSLRKSEYGSTSRIEVIKGSKLIAISFLPGYLSHIVAMLAVFGNPMGLLCVIEELGNELRVRILG